MPWGKGRDLFLTKQTSFNPNIIILNAVYTRVWAQLRNQRQLLTMDILVLATMKNAAKCDT